jgi:hypothetical protein
LGGASASLKAAEAEPKLLPSLLPSHMEKITHRKLIKTGTFHEFYTFKIPISYDQKRPKKEHPYGGIIDEDKRKQRQIENAKRAMQNVRRLVNGNTFLHEERPKFLTLTFHENITDLARANHEYTLFIKRLSYHLNQPIRYIAVPEFQKRGAVHYHVLAFNLPFIEQDRLQTLWGNIAFIQAVNNLNKTKGLYNYLIKYMYKSFQNTDLAGKKRYFQTLSSQPTTIYDETAVSAAYFPLIEKQSYVKPTTYEMKSHTGQIINQVTKEEYQVI